MRSATVSTLLFLACTSTVYGRSLLAPAPSPVSSLRIPFNRRAVAAALNATAQGTAILAQAGRVNETSTSIRSLTTGDAHGAAEELYSVAPGGQASAVHATVAAVGASLLAAGGALTNNAAVISNARSALATANNLIANVRDKNILNVTDAQFANLAILTSMAHDGSLVYYWLNAAKGPRDNATFADQVENAAGLYETVEDELENGASNSLAVLSAQEVARNLLAAIYTYQGNSSAVAQQNIELAQILLKAVRAQQTGTQCTVTWSAVDPLLEKAVDSATDATESLTSASLNTAISDAQAVLSAAQCGALAPSLAPAAAISSAGRK